MPNATTPSRVESLNFVNEHNVTVIGVSSNIAADLFLRERIMVFGTVKGNIESSSGTSIIAKGGKIIGNIKGENLIVAGEVLGDVIGLNKVTLLDTAVVHGDIHHASIIKHEKARIEGRIVMRNSNVSLKIPS